MVFALSLIKIEANWLILFDLIWRWKWAVIFEILIKIEIKNEIDI